MATQILRTVDRWRFERPLALLLAAAAGFAVIAMPHDVFARLPVAGQRGAPAQFALALLLAIVCGLAGYAAMRRPAKAVPIDEDTDATDDIDIPSGLSEDRLLRLRRADRHPDAPPRAPIRASRDLGEPFMDVGTVPASSQPVHETQAEPAIVDGDYVEVEEPVEIAADAEAAPEPIDIEPATEAVPEIVPAADDPAEPIVAKPVAEAPAVEPAVPMPVESPVELSVAAAAPRQDSIVAMMDRLSAGIERRAGRPMAPTRDMRPALRDALDELNRLAARRS